MSKSLNINAPQIVQTRNTLNAVPSGSTAEEDYNVKYVPQSLTDAQKAQARQNIGAAAEGGGGTQVQANWNETDTASPAYIQNKPTIPAAQVQSDWNQSDDTAVDYIKNKPSIGKWNSDFDQTCITLYSSSTGRIISNQIVAYSRVRTWQYDDDEDFMYYPGEISYFDTATFKTIVKFNRANFEFTISNFSSDLWIWSSVSAGYLNSILSNHTGNNVNIVVRYNGDSFNYEAASAGKVTYWFTNNKVTSNIASSTNQMADIVLFDEPMTNVNYPSGLIADTTNTIYVPKSRYTEFATKMQNDTHILNKTEQYDFIVDCGNGTLKMITLG